MYIVALFPTMRASLRPVALLLLAVVAGTVLLGGSVPIVSTPLDAPDERTPQFVDVETGEFELWPYVAAETSFQQPASSINVVFYGAPDRVRHLLTRTDEWNETVEEPVQAPENESAGNESPGNDSTEDEAEPEAVQPPRVVWSDLSSADRFTYVREDGSGTWIGPSYQLHRGDYLGSQHHLRVYELGEDRVAVQAHTEHWDWLLLTHVVDSLQAARLEVEDDFMGRPYVEEIHREYYDNGDTFDADGWATVIRLTFILPVLGAAALRSTTSGLNTPLNRRRVALAAVLPGLLFGVRVVGIAAERTLPVPVDTVAMLLYPFVALGLPVAAYFLGRELPPVDAFAIAAVAVGLAVRLDYSVLAISVIPIEVVVHRAIAAVALGLLASGAGRTAETNARNALVIGAGLWLAVLLAAVV